jgi:hypothetical protein
LEFKSGPPREGRLRRHRGATGASISSLSAGRIGLDRMGTPSPPGWSLWAGGTTVTVCQWIEKREIVALTTEEMVAGPATRRSTPTPNHPTGHATTPSSRTAMLKFGHARGGLEGCQYLRRSFHVRAAKEILRLARKLFRVRLKPLLQQRRRRAGVTGPGSA